MQEREVALACQILDVGADFCASLAVTYTEALFRLSKAMVSCHQSFSHYSLHVSCILYCM